MSTKYDKKIEEIRNEFKKEQNEFKKEQQNKFRRFVIFAIFLCLVLSGITGVASYSLAAGQVSYTAKDTTWEVENTQDAIDELRDNVGASLVGSIFSYMGTSAPYGYLACDGTQYNISDYPRLANHINRNFGSTNYFGGDGSTTFAVPDLRGEFLRGTGTNSITNLSGANVGQHTNEGLPNITASLDDMYSQAARGAFSKTNLGWHPAGPGGAGSYNGTLSFNAANSNSIYGNSEHVTPTNTSVLYIIKY